MKYYTEPSREIPVAAETEVLVVGGGPAGFGAALHAARMGRKTMLIEQYGAVGGVATTGIMSHWTGRNAGAVCQILAEIGAEAQKGYDIKESQPKTADFSCIVQFCCPQHTHSGTIRQEGKLTSAVPSQAGGRNAVWRGSSAHGWPRG